MENVLSNTRNKNVQSQREEYLAQERDSDENILAGEMTDTELSQEMFYEGVKKIMMKSVKRRETRHTIRSKKRKANLAVLSPTGNDDDDFATRAYSRCSIRYFHDIMRHVRKSNARIQLVQALGFGELLELDDCLVPRLLVQFIADNCSPDSEEIVLGSKSIPISVQSVKDILDIPEGDLLVSGDEEEGKTSFLSLFGLSEVRKISYFGDKIKHDADLGDVEFCRCFMAVALGSFLCPNSSTKIGTKYLGALVDVGKIRQRNWCKFVHDWLIFYIKKYLKDKRKENRLSCTLGGCIYPLSVRYLDFVDFGAIKLPTTFPRIRVWKGDLIKHFSDMDIGKNGKYGARPVKDISETCYAYKSRFTDSELRDSIEEILGNYIDNMVKVNIVKTFQNHMKDQEPRFLSKAHDLFLDTLRSLKSSFLNSSDTEKLNSLEGNQNSVQTGSIEIIEEDKEDDFEVEENLPSKRPKLDDNPSSQHSSSKQTPKSDAFVGHDMGNQNQYQTAVQTIEDNNQVTEECTMVEQNAQIFGKTVSLDYMLPPKEQKHLKIEDVVDSAKIQKEKNVTADGDAMFAGFEKTSHNGTETNVGFDENKTTATQTMKADRCLSLIAKQYGESDDSSSSGKLRADYLKEAEKKYFFYDASYPSFRMFEYEDDKGTYIEEPELWRPCGPRDQSWTFNKKDVHNGTTHDAVGLVNEENDIAKCHSSSKNTNASEYDSGIKCAQKQPSLIEINDTPEEQKHTEFSAVNLVSPEPSSHGISSQSKLMRAEGLYGTKSSQQSYYPKENATTVIRGIRLFRDDENDLPYNGNEQPEIESDQRQAILPEVEILGERDFRTSCNNLCNKTDYYYNQQMSLSSATSSYGKENIQPKRSMNPSRYYSSPYDNNMRPVIQSHTHKLYNSIMCLSGMPEHMDKWVVNIDNCTASMLQVGNSFKPNGWVEAYVINTFCRKLFRDNHPKESKKHYFFHTSSEYFLEKWKNDFTREKWKQNVLKGFKGAGSARPLHLSDRLYFPSLFEAHFFVFVVDIKNRNFTFLDSLFGKDSSYHKACDNKLIRNFKSTWHEAGLKNLDFDTFDTIFPNVPKQAPKTYDCGIFVMKLMELWCPRNPGMYAFSAIDIPGFRIQLGVDIVFNQHNTEEEQKTLIQEFNPKFHRV